MTQPQSLPLRKMIIPGGRPFRIGLFLFSCALAVGGASYTAPATSFAADSLMKVLQAKGWLEAGFQSQEIYYRAKTIDPGFAFFPIHTTVTAQGEHVGPFPFANTILTAPFIAANAAPLLIYFSALLFCGYLALLFEIAKRYWAVLIAAVGTPLFHHFISFSDVAAAAVLTLLAVLLISRKGPFFSVPGKHSSALSGFLIGAACWFRPEVLILAGCLILSTACVKLFRDKRLPEELPEILKFSGLFAATLFAFVCYNYLRYNLILGPRIESNQAGLSFGMAARLANMKELLFTGNGRVGFLSFSPWYGIALLCLFTWKRWSENSRILSAAFLLNLAVVSLLAPNNSNIDWGTRYLSCSAFIPVLLVQDLLSGQELRTLTRRIVWGLFAVLILYSASVNQRVLKSMRKSSLQLAWIQSEIPWDRSKVFVTRNVEIANTFGLQYLSQTILLIGEKAHLDQILAHPDVKQVVLVEHAAQPALAQYAREKYAGRFSIVESKSASNLLSLTELKSSQ